VKDDGALQRRADLDTAARTITIDVDGKNDAPVGDDETVSTTEDIPYAFETTDFPFSDPNDSAANDLLAVYDCNIAG